MELFQFLTISHMTQSTHHRNCTSQQAITVKLSRKSIWIWNRSTTNNWIASKINLSNFLFYISELEAYLLQKCTTIKVWKNSKEIVKAENKGNKKRTLFKKQWIHWTVCNLPRFMIQKSNLWEAQKWKDNSFTTQQKKTLLIMAINKNQEL